MYVNSRVSKSAKQLFIMYFLDSGRFLCVNAYFGASNEFSRMNMRCSMYILQVLPT